MSSLSSVTRIASAVSSTSGSGAGTRQDLGDIHRLRTGKSSRQELGDPRELRRINELRHVHALELFPRVAIVAFDRGVDVKEVACRVNREDVVAGVLRQRSFQPWVSRSSAFSRSISAIRACGSAGRSCLDKNRAMRSRSVVRRAAQQPRQPAHSIYAGRREIDKAVIVS